MSKVKTHLVDPKEKYRIIGDFFEIIDGLKNKKEIIDFFVGLLTPSEMLMMARRIQIAEMILNEKGYEQIRKDLGVSYQTIAKVYHWLHNENSGYKEQIEKQIKKKKNKQYSRSNYRGLLDKYPNHKFLKELFS